jgi:hypothetical protein
MRISTVVLGKAVRNAGISGRHVITKLMRKIQSIGQNIERWERDEVQIPGTKIALERAILDALVYPSLWVIHFFMQYSGRFLCFQYFPLCQVALHL